MIICTSRACASGHPFSGSPQSLVSTPWPSRRYIRSTTRDITRAPAAPCVRFFPDLADEQAQARCAARTQHRGQQRDPQWGVGRTELEVAAQQAEVGLRFGVAMTQGFVEGNEGTVATIQTHGFRRDLLRTQIHGRGTGQQAAHLETWRGRQQHEVVLSELDGPWPSTGSRHPPLSTAQTLGSPQAPQRRAQRPAPTKLPEYARTP